MKKNLIALAVFGAFSGAALAQSNVTLYGIVDVNFQYNDPDTGARPGELTQVISQVAVLVFGVPRRCRRT
jgi:predicted porin